MLDLSRFLPQQTMSTDQIIECGYDAMAIIGLCAFAAREGSAGRLDTALAGDIACALDLAREMVAAMHDTVEMHEDAIEAARDSKKIRSTKSI